MYIYVYNFCVYFYTQNLQNMQFLKHSGNQDQVSGDLMKQRFSSICYFKV